MASPEIANGRSVDANRQKAFFNTKKHLVPALLLKNTLSYEAGLDGSRHLDAYFNKFLVLLGHKQSILL